MLDISVFLDFYFTPYLFGVSLFYALFRIICIIALGGK